MDRRNGSYRVSRFPLNRRMIVDAGRHWRRQAIVYGLTEFDITDVRARLREHSSQTGERLSLTAYLIACLGRAVAAYPAVQARRGLGDRLVIFADVDVSVVIEAKQGDRSFPVVHVVRKAQDRTLREVNDEIRGVQADALRIPSFGRSRAGKLFLRLPTVLRDCAYWFVMRSPGFWKRQGGTVGLTALGMFGAGGGWGLPLSNQTLSLCIGGVVTRPAYIGSQLQPREFIGITVAVDHDLVDGGPAARFLQRLKELVESGSLLDGTAVQPTPQTESAA